MKTSVGLVHLLACLLEPFMPSFSISVFKQLNLPPEEASLSDEKGEVERAKRPWEILPAGHHIGKPEPLFREMKDEEVNSLRKKFSGVQLHGVEEESDRAKLAEQQKQHAVSADGSGTKQQAKKPIRHDAKSKRPGEPEMSITRLDIRVGLIKKAVKHPDADSLYVEEIDVGEEKCRTVVSGLAKHIPLDELQNLKVCVLCNLKPATMRGIKSHAMVLAASNSDRSKIELVEPPESAAVGERVTFNGFLGVPDDVLNPKKKVWEALQLDLRTNQDLVACYKGIPFATSAGACKVRSISMGTVS